MNNPTGFVSRPQDDTSALRILITVFLNVLAFGTILPALPLRIGEIVGHDRVLQAGWLGILTATYWGMQFLCAPILGALSDRFGRRPLLLVSIITVVCHYLVFASASSMWLVLAMHVVTGTLDANAVSINAWTSDRSTSTTRARAFGRLGIAFGLALVAGPFLGAFAGMAGPAVPFYVAAGVIVVNLIYSFFCIPESLAPALRRHTTRGIVNPFAPILQLTGTPGASTPLLVFTLSALAYLINSDSWVLFTHFRFHWGVTENGISLGIFGGITAVVQGVLLAPLLKHAGEKRLLRVSLLWGAAAYAGYALAPSTSILYALMLCAFLKYTIDPTLRAMLSRQVAPDRQGALMGSMAQLFSLLNVIAPAIASSTLASFATLPSNDIRLGTPFFISAALMCMAFAVAAWCWRGSTNRVEPIQTNGLTDSD